MKDHCAKCGLPIVACDCDDTCDHCNEFVGDCECECCADCGAITLDCKCVFIGVVIDESSITVLP